MSARFRGRRAGHTILRCSRVAHAAGLGLSFALLASSACGPAMAETQPTAAQGSLGIAGVGTGIPQERVGTRRFRVAGTAIGPGTREAQLIVLNGTSPGGKVYSVTEGSLVEGYRVMKITRDEVTLEVQGKKDGKPLRVPVGNPAATPVASMNEQTAAAPGTPSGQPAETASAAVQEMNQSSQAAGEPAAPSNQPTSAGVSDFAQLPLEVQTAVRAQTQTFLQELSRNQTFRNKLEEVRPQLLLRAGTMKR